MRQFFKKFFLFFVIFLVIGSSAVLAVPSAEKSESRAFGSIVRFLVAKTNPISLLSLSSSQLDQKLNQKLNQELKKIVRAVKSSAKVVLALKVKPSIRLKKTHPRKTSRLLKMTIKPKPKPGADSLHAGSGYTRQCLFKILSFGELAPKELRRLFSRHYCSHYYSRRYSGYVRVGSRLQAFHSERSTAHCGKKTSDGSDRRGCTRLFGGSIYGRQGFSYSQNFSYSNSNSTNVSEGLAEVRARFRLCEHVRVGLFRMPKDKGEYRLMMSQKSSMPNASNLGDGFKFSNFYILIASIL